MNPLNRVPLHSLRAVEAVARLGTLRAAAEDLGVSLGAVSQQVIQAERVLGLTLFERRHSGMVPAPQAVEVLALLRRAFADLTTAVARASPPSSDRITVSVAPAFAVRWLNGRLPRFRKSYPDIKVRLDAELAVVDPTWGEVDLCVRVGRGQWPGLRAERLIPQIIFPVCSPEMAKDIRDHADLATVPVIRDVHADFGWQDWLCAEGRLDVVPGEGPLFSDAQLCLDAAIAGEGVYLTFESVAVDPLATGRLVEPFRGRHSTAKSYWLVMPADGPVRRPVRVFADWLKEQISEAGLGQTQAPQ